VNAISEHHKRRYRNQEGGEPSRPARAAPWKSALSGMAPLEVIAVEVLAAQVVVGPRAPAALEQLDLAPGLGHARGGPGCAASPRAAAASPEARREPGPNRRVEALDSLHGVIVRRLTALPACSPLGLLNARGAAPLQILTLFLTEAVLRRPPGR
jgi:hypothetical protein